VGEHIAMISDASAQQRTGIEQVNRAVTELDASTQQNHLLVANAGQASQELLAVAQQLSAAVGQFRLEAAAATPRLNTDASSPLHQPEHALA
jgi:methyl-accepting chemotaxis protein